MKRTLFAALGCLMLCAATSAAEPTQVPASDWPQFMRDAAHTGDAAGEVLRLPLGLATCVQLGDAILSSPAVVGGRVYVVDQMGSAYAVDPRAGKVLWKVSPDGDRALGGNTSSPCVAQGKLYYGTTAGRVHILDLRDGSLVASIDVGSPIPGSLTYANDSLYFQTLDARLVRMGLDGKILWSHDHYRDYKFTGKLASWPVGYQKDQFGGGEIAVSGKRVVANVGCDLLCLEDQGDKPALVWCNRSPICCMGPAICGDWVYVAQPDNDGQGGFRRVRLADGASDPKQDRVDRLWMPFATPAVRDQTVFVQGHTTGMWAYDFAKGSRWKTWDSLRGKANRYTPGVASAALSRDHCVFATLTGEIYAVTLDSQGVWNASFGPAPFRYAIPNGRFITSSPVIAGGAVYFGADDGCLYGLAPGGQLEARGASTPLHQPRSKIATATAKKYAWPGPYGEAGNTSYLDDPGLKPPFRVRWIAPSHAGFKQPMIASETDVFFSSLEGTVAAYEQATGRLRWRQRVKGPAWCRQSPCYADGCLYVPRPGGYAKTNAFVPEGPSQLHCLDVADGSIRWSVPLGGSFDSLNREAPTCVGGVLAYPFLRKGALIIQAWDAKTGKEIWSIELGNFPAEVGVSGCVLDGTMYFSCQSSKVPGQTVAIEPATGKVLWRNTDYGGNRNLAGRDGKLLLHSAEKYTCCLSAKDGALVWKHDEKATFRYAAAFGPDLVVGRRIIGWSRTNEAYRSDTGKPVRDDGKPLFMSPRDHGCGPVALVSSGFTLSTATSGLFAVDVKTGLPAWNSPGFGSSICANPALANGRCFVNPQFSARIYCFEPFPIAPEPARSSQPTTPRPRTQEPEK